MSADNIKMDKKYYWKHREKILAQNEEWRKKNPGKSAAYRRAWYQKNKEHCQKVNRAYQHKHKKKIAEQARCRRRKRKIKVITHYGNGKCVCLRCNETRLAALTIDHINGEGAKHRRALGEKRGHAWYKWLIDNGYPEGYQSLCMNCQFVKREKNNEWRPRGVVG